MECMKMFRCHCGWGPQELCDHWECDYEWFWNLRVHSRKQRGFHPSAVFCPYQRWALGQESIRAANSAFYKYPYLLYMFCLQSLRCWRVRPTRLRPSSRVVLLHLTVQSMETQALYTSGSGMGKHCSTPSECKPFTMAPWSFTASL